MNSVVLKVVYKSEQVLLESLVVALSLSVCLQIVYSTEVFVNAKVMAQCYLVL